MSSANYRLDWYTPLTGSGGSARSANYAVEFTIGQSATGRISSTAYRNRAHVGRIIEARTLLKQGHWVFHVALMQRKDCAKATVNAR